MNDGFIRVASATPKIRVADCEYNASAIIEQAKQAAQRGASMIVFPELCITGYTCHDLFLQRRLLIAAENALERIIEETKDLEAVIIVGVPVPAMGKLYNCAAVICKGELLGLPAKTFIPNYSEFYELRHFTPVKKGGINVEYAGRYASIGQPMVFGCTDMPEFCFGVEICEDVWTPDPPSTELAKNGALIIANISASDEVIGKADYRRTLVKAHSGSLSCTYAYADSGIGESTQDMIFAGLNIIAENGSVLAESKTFSHGLTIADIDIKKLSYERRRMNTF